MGVEGSAGQEGGRPVVWPPVPAVTSVPPAEESDLPEDMAPELQAWVVRLRWLLKRTGISQNAYAARVGLSPGTLSKYRHGKSMPVEIFVEALLEQQDRPLTGAVRDDCRELWEQALRVASAHEYEKHLLRREVRDARLQTESLAHVIDGLSRRVNDTEHDKRELESKVEELRGTAARESARSEQERQEYRQRITELETEGDTLRHIAQVARQDLENLQRTHDAVQNRAEHFLQRLHALEEQSGRELSGTSPGQLPAPTEASVSPKETPTSPTSDDQSTVLGSDRRAHVLDTSTEEAAEAFALFEEIWTKSSSSVTSTTATGDSRAKGADRALEFGKDRADQLVRPYLTPVDVQQTARQLRKMTPGQVADVLGVHRDRAAELLGKLDHGQAADALGQMDRGMAAYLLERVDRDLASGLLGRLDRNLAADLLERMSKGVAAVLLMRFGADLDKHSARESTARKAAPLLAQMDRERAADLLGRLDRGHAADLVGQLDRTLAADLLGRLDQDVTADLLRWLDGRLAGSVLGHMGAEKAVAVLQGMTHHDVEALLRQMEPTQVQLLRPHLGR